jgi:DNA transposition AAA+ family ATPase
MNQQAKYKIANELNRMGRRKSQKRLALMCQVSTGTISQMINGNHENISDEMWSRVKVTLGIDPSWTTVETQNFTTVHNLLLHAQEHSISLAISDNPGIGKSEAFKAYDRQGSNVIYVECKNSWTKKTYMRTLLATAGVEAMGTTEQLIEKFINHMKGLASPIVIIDQFDKLKDPQVDLFMDFYNDLNGHCGFVLSGVKAFEKRVLKSVNRDKIGYAEIYSRIGRKFVKLDPISFKDVTGICKANGITDEDQIDFIFNNCENDLRRVKRDVEIRQQINRKASQQQELNMQ